MLNIPDWVLTVPIWYFLDRLWWLRLLCIILLVLLSVRDLVLINWLFHFMDHLFLDIFLKWHFLLIGIGTWFKFLNVTLRLLNRRFRLFVSLITFFFLLLLNLVVIVGLLKWLLNCIKCNRFSHRLVTTIHFTVDSLIDSSQHLLLEGRLLIVRTAQVVLVNSGDPLTKFFLPRYVLEVFLFNLLWRRVIVSHFGALIALEWRTDLLRRLVVSQLALIVLRRFRLNVLRDVSVASFGRVFYNLSQTRGLSSGRTCRTDLHLLFWIFFFSFLSDEIELISYTRGRSYGQ
jgi:hypothetical protein